MALYTGSLALYIMRAMYCGLAVPIDLHGDYTTLSVVSLSLYTYDTCMFTHTLSSVLIKMAPGCY